MVKTSFLNLVKKNFNNENDDWIIVDFNPWSNHSSDFIIKDFFDHFQSKIRPSSSFLANQLINYAEKLSSISKNPITQTLEVFKFLKTLNHTSSNDFYVSINQELKELDKKILIFIDDLDRLNVNELLATIRLIRNTANFSNTFFIVAYDRRYVLQAIKEHNPVNYEHFLEKIFQLEINLPYFKPEILREKTVESLCAFISEKHHKEIKDSIFGNKFTTEFILDFWIGNIRDVTRLTNSVNINFKAVQGEVVFNEFLKLELLRLKFPSVYELLFRDRDKFLTTEGNSERKKYFYKLKDETNTQETNKTKQKQVILYLKENDLELAVPQKYIPKIEKLLKGIFCLGSNPHFQSVIWPSNFNKYFSYSLWSTNLSEVAFSKARKKEKSIFLNEIDTWYENDLRIELSQRFKEIKQYDDQKDYENVISGFFRLGKKESLHPDFIGHLFSFDNGNLREKIIDCETRIKRGYFHVESDSWHKSFICELFSNATEPYLFESQFIGYLLQWNVVDFPLTQEELEKIVQDYFRKHCDAIEKMDGNLWPLFHCCKVREWHNNNGGYSCDQEEILKDAIEVFKGFILDKDFKGFLASIISQGLDSEAFGLFWVVPKIFGDWDGFRSFLVENKEVEPQLIEEYLQFFDKLKEEGFSQFVKFKFEKLIL